MTNIKDLGWKEKKLYRNLTYGSASPSEVKQLQDEYLYGYNSAIDNFKDMINDRIKELNEIIDKHEYKCRNGKCKHIATFSEFIRDERRNFGDGACGIKCPKCKNVSLGDIDPVINETAVNEIIQELKDLLGEKK